MGGPGSGDWYRFDSKRTVESCTTLDVNGLARDGVLKPLQLGGLTWGNTRTGDAKASVDYSTRHHDDGLLLILSYSLTIRGERHSVELPIRLITTRPHFGGKRWWFICPLGRGDVACQRRVGKLYLSGRYFGCRHCHDLTYISCQESHRYDKALGSLGADFGMSADQVSRLLRQLGTETV